MIPIQLSVVNFMAREGNVHVGEEVQFKKFIHLLLLLLLLFLKITD